MSWKTKYDIEFKGLKEGLHDYEFKIDKGFFVHFEKSPVERGEVKVKVKLEKRSSFLKLNFAITGWLELVCDRCLENYQQEIKADTDLFVKFGEEKEFNENDNIVWVLPEEHVINIAQIIYEYIVLSIPLRHVHPNKNGVNSCNPEMIKKLKNISSYKKQKKEEKKIDPRWEALKKWQNNN